LSSSTALMLACRSRRDRTSSNLPSSVALRSASSRSGCEAMIEANPQRLTHPLTDREQYQRARAGSKRDAAAAAEEQARDKDLALLLLRLFRSFALSLAHLELELSHKGHRPSRPPRLHERRPNTILLHTHPRTPHTHTHSLSLSLSLSLSGHRPSRPPRPHE